MRNPAVPLEQSFGYPPMCWEEGHPESTNVLGLPPPRDHTIGVTRLILKNDP